MIIPSPAWPLVLQLLVADGVPKLDVTASCRGAAEVGISNNRAEDLAKTCIKKEQQTRNELEKAWSGFPVSDRVWCTTMVQGYAPTYTELATCLDMKSALANIKSGNSRSGPTTTGTGSATRR
jgi:hypothetical protein